MDAEPGIAKQYKYLYWCVCKNDRGKMVENGEKGKKVVFFLFVCVCVCVSRLARSRVRGKTHILGFL